MGIADTLVSEAHSLTGSSGSYGASRLSALARQLEAMARHDSPEAAGELLAQLEAEFERVKCAFALLRQVGRGLMEGPLAVRGRETQPAGKPG